MTEHHLLHLDAVESIETLRKFIVFGRIAHHFEDNYSGAGTVVARHLMKPDPGFDFAPVTGKDFLDFRNVLNPVPNVKSQNDVSWFFMTIPLSLTRF
jgi:hypothetical protein